MARGDRREDIYLDFRTLLDYIHLNPLRAGLPKLEQGLDHFKWSSLSFYRLPPPRRQSWQEIHLSFWVTR